MRISLQWLSEWIGGPLPAPKDLAARLTMAGLEIEGVAAAAPPLPGVIVGEIVERVPHPNADTLSVCQVNTGSATVQIVCGAPNARAGMKAPLAMVGAKLPGGLEIKQAKLRGVDSMGMLCSARELGLAEDGQGLLDLPAELRTGATLVEALGLDDTILEVNLTPNRGDCMSVAGIAREVAALTGQTLTGPAIAPVAPASSEILPVELTPGAGCVRFASRVIRGLDPSAKSPAWMQERLRRAGLRPISAAVDVTNYVMLELGQPMHAYDLRELAGGIVVRRARVGETLKLLDGRDITMDESVLVIADHDKPLGLAGVMGGDHSGIGDDTAVISVATIRGVFSSNFQITGVMAGEARELALLLRAGSLAAPLYIVEQRTVGPSLGQDNVKRGFQALMIGLLGMFIFLALYYRRFGLVACLVLFMNMVLLTALMSLLQATLSLPGIAGIVLTVGMAADANVLIFERIREELRNGMSPHAAINAGFDKAFSAIADSNITTLIAGVVLFTFGSGPVRGFAVTLCLGILTSLFSAILGSRALIHLIWGRQRKLEALPI